jgi:hypothetical protein
MLSQLTQIQADLINLKQELIEIEMSSFSHPIEKQTIETLPF